MRWAKPADVLAHATRPGIPHHPAAVATGHKVHQDQFQRHDLSGAGADGRALPPRSASQHGLCLDFGPVVQALSWARADLVRQVEQSLSVVPLLD